MKAAVRDRYGGPETIRIAEVPRPVPGPDEVLVQVYAASVNSWDWDLLTGNVYGRLMGPLRPGQRVLGADLAGTVEATGPGAGRFRPGDAVVGDISSHGWGGFADYVAVPERVLVAKPAALSFAQAAAVPQAGTLALQGLRLRRPVQAGDRVLVMGGGGGCGSFAIQLARMAGAEVVAVDRREKLDFMLSLGAHEAIDFARADGLEAGPFDRIVDPVASRPMAAYRRALSPDGTLVVIGGRLRTLIGVGLAGLAARPAGQRLALLIWRSATEDMVELLELCAAGRVQVALDRVYPLEQTGAALRRVGQGAALGKVVVQVMT